MFFDRKNQTLRVFIKEQEIFHSSSLRIMHWHYELQICNYYFLIKNKSLFYEYCAKLMKKLKIFLLKIKLLK